MKSISLVAATLLLGAPAAYAARDISSPVETLVVKTGKTSAEFGNSFAKADAGDTFADRFDFSLPGVAAVDFNLSSVSVKASQGLDLTGFGIFNASSNALVVAGTQTSTGKIDAWTLASSNLVAGDYYFLVSGKMVSAGGSFAADGILTVSPVPEPGVPAMLLGGLGILAFVARRKR